MIATGARPRVLPGIEPEGSWSGHLFRGRGAEVARRHGLGRDRHEFASFFRTARRWRSSSSCRRSCRRESRYRQRCPQALREAGHQDLHRRAAHPIRGMPSEPTPRSRACTTPPQTQ